MLQAVFSIAAAVVRLPKHIRVGSVPKCPLIGDMLVSFLLWTLKLPSGLNMERAQLDLALLL